MYFVLVLNPLCDDKHVKAHTSGFKLNEKTRASRVDFGSLDEDNSAAFGQMHDGILCVSTPIVGEWRRSGRCSVGDEGKLERFNDRIPLVACLLDTEKGLIAKFKASR